MNMLDSILSYLTNTHSNGDYLDNGSRPPFESLLREVFPTTVVGDASRKVYLDNILKCFSQPNVLSQVANMNMLPSQEAINSSMDLANIILNPANGMSQITNMKYAIRGSFITGINVECANVNSLISVQNINYLTEPPLSSGISPEEIVRLVAGIEGTELLEGVMTDYKTKHMPNFLYALNALSGNNQAREALLETANLAEAGCVAIEILLRLVMFSKQHVATTGSLRGTSFNTSPQVGYLDMPDVQTQSTEITSQQVLQAGELIVRTVQTYGDNSQLVADILYQKLSSTELLDVVEILSGRISNVNDVGVMARVLNISRYYALQSREYYYLLALLYISIINSVPSNTTPSRHFDETIRSIVMNGSLQGAGINVAEPMTVQEALESDMLRGTNYNLYITARAINDILSVDFCKVAFSMNTNILDSRNILYYISSATPSHMGRLAKGSVQGRNVNNYLVVANNNFATFDASYMMNISQLIANILNTHDVFWA